MYCYTLYYLTMVFYLMWWINLNFGNRIILHLNLSDMPLVISKNNQLMINRQTPLFFKRKLFLNIVLLFRIHKLIVFFLSIQLYGLAVPLMMLYQLKHTVFSTQALMLYAGFSGLMIINSLWALYGNPVAVLQQVASPQIDRVLRRRKDN